LAAASDPATIAVLLEHRADVNPRGCVSVLATAVQRFRPAAVEALLAAGADVNQGVPIRTMPNFTLLELSLVAIDRCRPCRDCLTVINMLLNAGLRTRLPDGVSTALTLCVGNGTVCYPRPAQILGLVPTWYPIMTALVKHDPGMLEVVDREGKTPLLACIPNKCDMATAFLIDAGAHVTACDREGRTLPMMLMEVDSEVEDKGGIELGVRITSFNALLMKICNSILSRKENSVSRKKHARMRDAEDIKEDIKDDCEELRKSRRPRKRKMR
jgi:hypothetical protein